MSDNVNLLDINCSNKVGRFSQHFVEESAASNYHCRMVHIRFLTLSTIVVAPTLCLLRVIWRGTLARRTVLEGLAGPVTK